MLPYTSSRISRDSLNTAPRTSPEVAKWVPATTSPVALQGPAGLCGAPKRLQGANQQLSPLRSPLPSLHRLAATRPQREIQPEPTDLDPPQRQGRRPTLGELFRRDSSEASPLAPRESARKAQETPQPSLPKLGELLAQERREEEAERAEKTRQARQELAQLMHSALPDGGATMKRLKERASRKHPGTMAEHWHAVRHGGPKRMEGERRMAFEALVRADLMALAGTGGMEPLKAVDKMSEALAQGIFGQGILEKDRALLIDVLDGLSMGHLYREFNLKMTDATLPAFTDAQVLERPKELGRGNMSTTYEVQLRDADGAAITAVFKPLESEDTSFVALRSGIPKDDPQTAMRNIATVDYAKQLGFDVIADTRVALISMGRDPLKPTLGLIMEMAHGEPAERVDVSVLERADVSAGVVQLQLLDHLTGQGDRHGNNYFIHVDPDGGAKVMGIDNDQCFGKKLTKPEDIRRIPDNSQRWGFLGTDLPPVVDTRMERAIQSLAQSDIRAILEDTLDDEEIGAAVQRHQGLKDHITRLRADGLVIDPDRWADPDVQQRMTEENSYLGRELKWARAIP